LINPSLNQNEINPVNNKKKWKKLTYALLTTVLASSIILSGVYLLVDQITKTSLSKIKIPVIKASQQPIKIKPREPGGMVIRHQDKKIYDILDRTLKNKNSDPGLPLLKSGVKSLENQNLLKINKKIVPSLVKKTKPLKINKAFENKAIFSGNVNKKAKGFELQIAAMSSKKAALLFWKRVLNNSGVIFSSLKPNIKQIKIPGKRSYFRLRVGPIKQKILARKLCKKLKNKKMDCFVVEL